MKEFLGIVLCIMTLGQQALAGVSDFTEIQFSNSNYFRSNENYYGGDDKADNISNAGVVLRTQASKMESSHAVDLKAFYSVAENTGYLNLKEVYFDFGGTQSDLAIGRRIYNWSESDVYWQTGLWQPHFRWDGLRPEENGLLAGFWREQINKNLKASAFLSPLHVPSLGPEYREKDDRLTSVNPWFRPPPPEANILGENTDVYSTVERPDTNEVIFNPGLGGRLDYEFSNGETLGFAYAYKPIPQLFISYDYKLRTAAENGGVELTFYPWVAYHHVATLDYSIKNRRSGSHYSISYEKPTRMDENADRVHPNVPESVIASFLIYRDIHGEGESAFKAYGGLIRHWGGFGPDGGPATSESSNFEIRPRYIAAIKAGLKYPIWSKWRRLSNSIEANYDFAVNGGTLLTEFETALADGWLASIGYDMIGVFATPDKKYENSFINTYRANDRVNVRMSYVY